MTNQHTRAGRVLRRLPRLLVVVLVGSATPVHADGGGAARKRIAPARPQPDRAAISSRARERAEWLYEQAKSSYDEGKLRGEEAPLSRALHLLRLAHSLWPHPSLLLNQAQVEKRLGHCRQARESYQRYLLVDSSGDAASIAKRQLKALGDCGEPAPDEEIARLELRLAPSTLRVADPAAVRWEELSEATGSSPVGTAGPSQLRVLAPWLMASASAVAGATAGLSLWDARRAAARAADVDSLARAARYDDEEGRALNRARLLGMVSLGFGVGVAVLVLTRPSIEAVDSEVTVRRKGSLSVARLPSGGWMTRLQGSF